MGKDKKKSDWENLQEMLSQDADAPQNVDDWNAVETTSEVETEAEKSVAKAPAAKPKRACGEKKAKATKTRKKPAPKTDKIDAALATPVADAPQDAETIDLTVAEPEKAPKKRRRTTKKVEQDETELVKNVLKLENETKAKKRTRAKAAEENPFVGLLSQIERVAQDEPEAVAEEPAVEAEPETAAPVEPASETPTESGDFFADFFADANVEELEISWGRPRADEPEANADEPEADAEEPETVVESEVEPTSDDAPRRRDRRRRRDDRAPREETPNTAPAAPASDDVKTDVDLDDLEAFFATDAEDEGVGFAPRRESKKAEKAPQAERVEKARPVETPESSEFCVDSRDADDDDDEPRSKRKRRRRRGGRRSFEEEVEPNAFDDETLETEPETADAPEAEAEAYEAERAPRERRRRERRPRREREIDVEPVESDEAETPDERRAVAPERVLPSWSDAISHVVRFNMSRRVNRRR
ncbi:MAG: hypothetical protein IJE97_04560 [Thermoguttaceae bacterium]|nr:hypothetical protein [Thermoguttaceae bacterium]MBQ6827248.1 hypothetical protein [Thermoguttaceae bacterium]